MAAIEDATEPDEALEPVCILIIDDQDDAGVWDHRFTEDPTLRRMKGATTAFKRYARPCRTAAQARTAIEGAVREQVPLSLIFIDNKLQLTATGYETREEAIGLMLFIAAQHGDRPRPACVLATAEPDPLLRFAFMTAGGTYCFDKKARTQIVLNELWWVIEREDRWRADFEEPLLRAHEGAEEHPPVPLRGPRAKCARAAHEGGDRARRGSHRELGAHAHRRAPCACQRRPRRDGHAASRGPGAALLRVGRQQRVRPLRARARKPVDRSAVSRPAPAVMTPADEAARVRGACRACSRATGARTSLTARRSAHGAEPAAVPRGRRTRACFTAVGAPTVRSGGCAA
jgi:hypothetical protein